MYVFRTTDVLNQDFMQKLKYKSWSFTKIDLYTIDDSFVYCTTLYIFHITKLGIKSTVYRKVRLKFIAILIITNFNCCLYMV